MKKVFRWFMDFYVRLYTIFAIIAVVMVFLIAIVAIDCHDARRRNNETQLAKRVTVETQNGSLVDLTGYKLIGNYIDFKLGEKVYLEFELNSNDSVPRALWHAYDVEIKDGKTFAYPKWRQAYLTDLRPGKVVAIK
jgi:hypothetical protein